jgi:hypothetical protein
MLSGKFGPLSEETVQRIRQILTPEQTLELADAVLSFTTLTDLNAWLDAKPPIPPDESYLWDGTYDDDDAPPPAPAQ